MDGYFYRVPLSYFICVRTKSIIDSFQTVDDRLQVEDQSDTSHPFCLAIQYGTEPFLSQFGCRGLDKLQTLNGPFAFWLCWTIVESYLLDSRIRIKKLNFTEFWTFSWSKYTNKPVWNNLYEVRMNDFLNYKTFIIGDKNNLSALH